MSFAAVQFWGHDCNCVSIKILVDLETKRPIALLEKRNKVVISQYLSSLGSEVLNQIEEVNIDLWMPYKSLQHLRLL